MRKDIQRAAEVIQKAHALLITSGAGMGVDSGLPDFRGDEGLWKAYPPLKKRGLSLPSMSTPHWFKTDPKFAWGFFGHRIMLYQNTVPHNGFRILQKWCKNRKKGHFVMTSNVDNQFQISGFDENEIVECHGSLSYFQNLEGTGSIWPCPKDFSLEIDTETFNAVSPLPTGPPDADPGQQTLSRPNVLMFNDHFWVDERTEQQFKQFSEWQYRIMPSESLVVIEIGAGLAVPTIRYQSERSSSMNQNSYLVRINPRDTEIPRSKDISIPLGGLEALTLIDECLNEMNNNET
eukprot:TCONS_00049926-protein